MSEFERVYQTDPSREMGHNRERHLSIEISEQEYLDRIRQVKVSKDMEQEGFVYIHPDEDSMSTHLKDKFCNAKKSARKNVLDLRKKDEKVKSKSPKRKHKTVPS